MTSTDTTGRPNVLLVLADQWPAAFLSSYGCEVPDLTPNLDALAARGVRFDRHYTPAPICGPSRTALFSGCSPSVSGSTGNDTEPRPDLPFLSRDLRALGYRTEGYGKFHFTPHTNYPPEDLTGLGFDTVAVTEDTKHGRWLDWVVQEHPEYAEQALAVSWPMPYLAHLPPEGQDRRPAWEAARRRHLDPLQQPPHRRIVHRSPLPAELHQTTWITDRAVESLDRLTDQDDPFFLYVSYVDPHDPYDPPDPWFDRYDWRDIAPPLPQEWSEEDGPWQYRAFQRDKFQLAGFDDDTWARLRAAYLGSCAFVDSQIGRLLDHLESSGRAEDTLVVFTTDHGDVLGDHGLLMKGPWHYDKAIRCPLLVAGPGVAAGKTVQQLTSHLDLHPTLLQRAGAEPLLGEGVPLPLADPATGGEGHSRLVVETNSSYLGPDDQVRTLLTDDGWRLTVFPGQTYGELFHLPGDPEEQHNLYTDPAHQARRLAMTEELVAAMAAAVIARRARPAPAGGR